MRTLHDDGQSRPFIGSFSRDSFIESHAWERLQFLLGSNGGSYGLSGPRGVGKTWLMQKAMNWAREKGGLGVWFPSPSEFEPTAFLASISDVTAIAVEEFYDTRTRRQSRLAFRRSLIRLIAAIVLVGIAFLIIWAPTRAIDIRAYLLPGLAFLGALAGAAAILLFDLSRRQEDRTPLGRIRRRAEEVRLEVKYAVTRTESIEGSLEASGFLGSLFKMSRQRQLVERPATLSSLIHNFRSFVFGLASALQDEGRRAPVIIAIDELDKVHDAAQVASLLRDVKAILDVPGVHCLVSISSEAARALDLGTLKVRNEFNSSFYTVIDVLPFRPLECRQQLSKADPMFDEGASRAIGVLVGGVAREVARVADLVHADNRGNTTGPDAAKSLIKFEALAFWDEVVRSWDSSADPNQNHLLNIHRDLLSLATSPFEQPHDVESSWNPGWIWHGGLKHYGEQWRRLLIRREVALRLATDPALLEDDEACEALQEIIRIASLSAELAKDLLDRQWLGSSPPSTVNLRAPD